MNSLPLFHRIAGQPVIVLGEGALAEPKRRLVEQAGGEPVGLEGIGRGARLAFIAHADRAACEADAARLRAAGLLVNVVDRPDLCDFTTPAILDREPVLVAIGTGGASAGLAKQLRLRLEILFPPTLGRLAEGLQAARARLRSRWPDAGDRRRALDAALGQGGPLDPLDESSAGRIEGWLSGDAGTGKSGEVTLTILSDDPEDLTLRQARLLGSADTILFDPAVSLAILARARADANRRMLDPAGPPERSERPEARKGLTLILRKG